MPRGHRRGNPAKGGSRKRRRADLEDLYHQVLEKEKLARRQQKRKSKEEHEDTRLAKEESRASAVPVIPPRKDLTTLLTLLGDGHEQSDASTETSVDPGESNQETDSECAEEARQGVNSSEELCLAKEETAFARPQPDESDEESLDSNVLATSNSCDDDDDDSMSDIVEGVKYLDATQLGNSLSPAGNYALSFQSFDFPMPASEALAATPHSTVITPPGFRTVSVACPYADRLEEMLKRVSTLLNSRPANVVPKIWNLWTKLMPEIERFEEPWRQAATEKIYLKTLQAATCFHAISTYMDVLVTHQSYENARSLRALTMLHIVNHLYKTRHLLERHNKELQRIIEEKRQGSTGTSPFALDPLGEDKFRDQGFTRTRVLIVAATRVLAKEFVFLLTRLLPGCKHVRSRKRFDKEFSVDLSNDGVSLSAGLEAAENGDVLLAEGKPLDYADLFRGNSDDNFRLGIKLHSWGITLYSDFHESDIIIASPLGLKLALERSEGGSCSDSLSSIEILLLDRCDVLKMQNLENVRDLLSAVNRKPTTLPASCDIRRLRQLFVEGMAHRYRQSIILTNGRRPEINALVAGDADERLCKNFRGVLGLHEPSVGHLPAKEAAQHVAKQLYLLIPCSSHVKLYDVVVEFIASQFPPSFLSMGSNEKILLVVPSYVEYLRIRKVLKKSELAQNDPRNLSHFRACHEHASNKMLTESRQMFRRGDVKLLITTERFLFYRRYYLRGADHVVFFGPPEYPELYLHSLQLVNDPSRAISVVYYTKFHALASFCPEQLLKPTQRERNSTVIATHRAVLCPGTITMLETLEECTALKFEHGPTLSFHVQKNSKSLALEISPSIKSIGSPLCYRSQSDQLFYLRPTGSVESWGVQEFLAKSANFTEVSLDEILVNITKNTYTFREDRTAVYTSLTLDRTETFLAAFSQSHLAVITLSANGICQSHVTLHVPTAEATNPLVDVAWTVAGDLLCRLQTGHVYAFTRVIEEESDDDDDNGPSTWSSTPLLETIGLSASIDFLGTTGSSTVRLDAQGGGVLTEFDEDIVSNVMILGTLAPFAMYVACPDILGPCAFEKIDCGILTQYLEDCVDLNLIAMTEQLLFGHIYPVGPEGHLWMLGLVWQPNDTELPSTITVFLRLQDDFQAVSSVLGVSFNDVQWGLQETFDAKTSCGFTSLFVDALSTMFIGTRTAPDVCPVSSAPAIIGDEGELYVVKAPESQQVSCYVEDFSGVTGVLGLIYIPKYSGEVPRLHGTLDAPLLTNPPALVVVQTDGQFSIHYIDCPLVTSTPPTYVPFPPRSCYVPLFPKFVNSAHQFPLSYHSSSEEDAHAGLADENLEEEEEEEEEEEGGDSTTTDEQDWEKVGDPTRLESASPVNVAQQEQHHPDKKRKDSESELIASSSTSHVSARLSSDEKPSDINGPSLKELSSHVETPRSSRQPQKQPLSFVKPPSAPIMQCNRECQTVLDRPSHEHRLIQTVKNDYGLAEELESWDHSGRDYMRQLTRQGQQTCGILLEKFESAASQGPPRNVEVFRLLLKALRAFDDAVITLETSYQSAVPERLWDSPPIDPKTHTLSDDWMAVLAPRLRQFQEAVQQLDRNQTISWEPLQREVLSLNAVIRETSQLRGLVEQMLRECTATISPAREIVTSRGIESYRSSLKTLLTQMSCRLTSLKALNTMMESTLGCTNLPKKLYPLVTMESKVLDRALDVICRALTAIDDAQGSCCLIRRVSCIGKKDFGVGPPSYQHKGSEVPGTRVSVQRRPMGRYALCYDDIDSESDSVPEAETWLTKRTDHTESMMTQERRPRLCIAARLSEDDDASSDGGSSSKYTDDIPRPTVSENAPLLDQLGFTHLEKLHGSVKALRDHVRQLRESYRRNRAESRSFEQTVSSAYPSLSPPFFEPFLNVFQQEAQDCRKSSVRTPTVDAFQCILDKEIMASRRSSLLVLRFLQNELKFSKNVMKATQRQLSVTDGKTEKTELTGSLAAQCTLLEHAIAQKTVNQALGHDPARGDAIVLGYLGTDKYPPVPQESEPRHLDVKLSKKTKGTISAASAASKDETRAATSTHSSYSYTQRLVPHKTQNSKTERLLTAQTGVTGIKEALVEAKTATKSTCSSEITTGVSGGLPKEVKAPKTIEATKDPTSFVTTQASHDERHGTPNLPKCNVDAFKLPGAAETVTGRTGNKHDAPSKQSSPHEKAIIKNVEGSASTGHEKDSTVSKAERAVATMSLKASTDDTPGPQTKAAESFGETNLNTKGTSVVSPRTPQKRGSAERTALLGETPEAGGSSRKKSMSFDPTSPLSLSMPAKDPSLFGTPHAPSLPAAATTTTPSVATSSQGIFNFATPSARPLNVSESLSKAEPKPQSLLGTIKPLNPSPPLQQNEGQQLQPSSAPPASVPTTAPVLFTGPSAFERKQYTFGMQNPGTSGATQPPSPLTSTSPVRWGEGFGSAAPSGSTFSIAERAAQLTSGPTSQASLFPMRPASTLFGTVPTPSPFAAAGGGGTAGPFGSLSGSFGSAPGTGAPSNLFQAPKNSSMGSFRIPDATK